MGRGGIRWFGLFLILAVLLFRFPTEPHRVGSDAFEYEILAKEVSATGRIAWLDRPLAAFGMAPLSLPPGSILTTAAFQQISGSSDYDFIVTVQSMLLGVLGMLGFSVLAHTIFRSARWALVSGAIYSLAPVFLFQTTQTLEARAFFTALLPTMLACVALWGGWRTAATRGQAASGPRAAILGVASIVSLAATLSHPLALAFLLLLIPIILLGSRFVWPLMWRWNKSPFQFKQETIAVIVGTAAIVGFLGVVDVPRRFTISASGLTGDLALAVVSARAIGGVFLLVPFAFFVRWRPNATRYPFLLALTGLILVLPLYQMGQYWTNLAVPFLVVFGTLGWRNLLGVRRAHEKRAILSRRLLVTTLGFGLVLSVSSLGIFFHPAEATASTPRNLSQEEIEGGVYLHVDSPNCYLGNDQSLNRRVSAVSLVCGLQSSDTAFRYWNPDVVSIEPPVALSSIDLRSLIDSPNSVAYDWYSFSANRNLDSPQGLSKLGLYRLDGVIVSLSLFAPHRPLVDWLEETTYTTYANSELSYHAIPHPS